VDLLSHVVFVVHPFDPMITLSPKAISQLDGHYLSDTALSDIQNFSQSYELRLRTYNALREKSDPLILSSLRDLMRSHRQIVQSHGNMCKRDMSYILRHIGIGILKDDAQGFFELVLWMENITKALHKEQSACMAYKGLQAKIHATMPPDMVALIDPYLETLIEGLSAGVEVGTF